MKPDRRNLHLAVANAPLPPLAPAMALAKMVFPVVRSGVGYDLLSPVDAAARSVIALLISGVWWMFWVAEGKTPIPANRGFDWFAAAIALLFAADIAVLARRWNDQRTGNGRPARDAGWSYATLLLPFPAWLSEIVITPAAIFGAGWTFRHTVSLDLGWFLTLAAFSYAYVAIWEMRLYWRKGINVVSDMARADDFGAQVEQAQGKARPTAAAREPDSIHDTATVGARPQRAEPPLQPAAASWRGGSQSSTPDYTSWIFRSRGRRGRGGLPATTSNDE